MIGYFDCATLVGLGGRRVRIEVDLARGLPSFSLVGLADNAVKEARTRVQAAITNSGFDFPKARICVNLAPADLRKDGTAFDLAMALAILQASQVIERDQVEGVAAIAELSLSGELRPVSGMLAFADEMKSQGFKTLIVAKENAEEASLISGLTIRVANNLAQLVQAFREKKIEDLVTFSNLKHDHEEAFDMGMEDVCGQENAKRAMLIAAAGGHNLIFKGGPGCGKSMMAARLPSILPPLDYEEAKLVTKIYSVAGLTLAGKLIRTRPFRAPHHSITRAGLVGGGSSKIKPGEISLANKGVLFLDEILEFPRSVLEVLRQPLEAGEITLSRAQQSVCFPAEITLVAALNPCPCGYFGQCDFTCQCSEQSVRRYQSRISGPLLDRIDLHVDVKALDLNLMTGSKNCEGSRSMREKVIEAREIQKKRFKISKTNHRMTRKELKNLANLSSSGEKFLLNACEKLKLSARCFDKILKVSRTVADLDHSKEIFSEHIAEGLHYRAHSI